MTVKNRIYKLKNENQQLKEQLQQRDEVLNEIRKYCKGAYEMKCYTKSACLDEENIEDILQIIDKVLGEEK